jgi:phage terminase large subunit-like protein
MIVPLSSDHDTLDGLNTTFALIDELHAHKTDQLVNVLKTSTGSRTSWQILEITTAGTNTEGVCYDHRKHTINVLKGIVQDPRWFGMIYTLDEGDDYRDPINWIKANPSLGRAKRHDYIQGEISEAQSRPSYESTVLRYDFNIWTQSTRAWITDDAYQATVSEINETDIKHLTAHGGLDIASTRDFTSFTLLFEDQDRDQLIRRTYFWLPAETMDDRMQRQLVNWKQWVAEGWISITPGNVQDDRTIAADIIRICSAYKVAGISYDKYQAHTGVVQDLLAQGLPCRPMPQGISYMSEPTKQLERLILQQKITNDTNPVYRWQLQNVSLYTDANDNIKVLKHKSNDKIDGVVSSINAVAEWLTQRQENGKTRSAYNRPDKSIILLK